ncbi:MAG: heavy-metal-associated domain-containing protein [Christensenellaceae bacterium]
MIFKKTDTKRIDVEIEGLCCVRCAEKVEGWLNLIDGVSAEVDHKRGRAVILTKGEVSDEVIRSAVEQSGVYRVKSIVRK